MAVVSDLIRSFLAELLKRSSAVTSSHYQKRLSSLSRQHGSVELSSLTKEAVLSWIASEGIWQYGPSKGESKAPDTIRTTIVAWEQFQRWLIESEQLEHPITSKLKKPGGRKRELLPTREETAKLLEHAPDDFKLIYRAMRLTGARPGELCRAEIAHFDRVAGEIVLAQHKTAAKTGKPRRIPVGHPALKEIVDSQIGQRVEGRIFLRSNGRQWTTEIFSARFRELKTRAGLRDGLVLYLARHEHATELYKKTGDIKSVADALGHAQISTTMRYTRVDGEQLKKNQQLFEE